MSSQIQQLQVALDKLTAEHEELQGAHRATMSKVTELEVAIQTMETTKRHIQEQAKVSEGIAQMRMDELMNQLDALQDTHAGCDGVVSYLAFPIG